MQTIDTDSYEDLQSKLRELAQAETIKKQAGAGAYYSPLLFRGQSDAIWKLETTLDRAFPKEVLQSEYRWMIGQLRIAVETALGISLPVDPDFAEDSVYGPPADYPMMVRARHHGFPSPLLDWTESRHIALFFAFSSAPLQRDGRAALFVFREHCGRGKSSEADLPHIIGLGPSIKTHRRHFQQKAWYTICRREDDKDRPIYSSHNEAFSANHPDQDRLWKFTIPWSERAKILEELDDMNVNAFTLFGSEESLMTTVANRLLRLSA